MQNEDTAANNEDGQETEGAIPSELETLQNRANMMGIKFHPNTGIDKLRAKIEAKLSGETQGLSAGEVEEAQVQSQAKVSADKPTYLTHAQYQQERENQMRKEINSLIRIRITCMNPNKAEWEGELFSVGSAKMGTFKKYVPFNAIDGWHVPKIIYDVIKDRKYSAFYNAKGPRGEKIRKAKLMPEFSVEVLPPLTREELKELAQRQAMANSN